MGERPRARTEAGGRRRRPGPARPPPGRLAARHSSGHPAVPYIPDSNKQNSVLMYYAAGVLASSETAGGRPGRAWSAPSSSCLGPCSHANTPSPRLLYVSLTITLRRSVSTRSSLRRSVSTNTLLTCQDVPGSHSAFLRRVKGHTQYRRAWERG